MPIVVPGTGTVISSAWGKSVADAINGLPEIAYSEATATVSVTATSSAAPTTIIAGVARTYDGQPVVLEFFAPLAVGPAVASGQLLITLREGATDLGFIGQLIGQSGAPSGPLFLRRRFTPSAGSHTYGIAAYVAPSGSGTIAAGTGGAGAYVPASLRVVRANPPGV